MNEFIENKIGHVYAVTSPCGSLVKIGRSKNPKERMKGIITYSGKLGDRYFSPKLKNCVIVEATLHKLFEKERAYGEWFRLSLSDAIKGIEEYIVEDFLADNHYVVKSKERSAEICTHLLKTVGIDTGKSIGEEIKELSQEEQEELVL